MLRNPGKLHAEKMTFENFDLESPYDAILGHPGLAQLQAIPYYSVGPCTLRMPGPLGTIMVEGGTRARRPGSQPTHRWLHDVLTM
jgi:hypothetical protein